MPDNAAVETKTIGPNGPSVTTICFGTSAIGDMPNTYGYSVDLDRAHKAVEAIFAGPVNFLDTARNYSNSEERIGEVIKARGGVPDGFVISSKLDRDMETNRFDAAQARRSLETSLKMLNVDKIDILHLHDPEYVPDINEVTGPNGSLAELMKMKEEGLARCVGLAAGKVDVMMPILRDWDFDALISHNRYTLVNRNAAPMFELAKERGIAVLNAAPYASGVLAKGSDNAPLYCYQPADEAMLAPVRRIEAICARHNIPTGAAALQFSLRDPLITSTIAGISKAERVQQTLDWANHPISDEAWAELLAVPYETGDPEATRDYVPG